MSLIFYEDFSPLETVSFDMVRQAMASSPVRCGDAEDAAAPAAAFVRQRPAQVPCPPGDGAPTPPRP
jgi:hypothetical protein